MKALCLIISAGEVIIVKKLNSCHLKSKDHINVIFHVHICTSGTCVSMIKVVARWTIHRG